jgi:hypothetical protein
MVALSMLGWAIGMVDGQTVWLSVLIFVVAAESSK